MASRGSCVHNSMVKKFGGIPKMLALSNFFKLLIVSDKMIHKAFNTHTALHTKPIRENFNFQYLPKLYIGFNVKS